MITTIVITCNITNNNITPLERWGSEDLFACYPDIAGRPASDGSWNRHPRHWEVGGMRLETSSRFLGSNKTNHRRHVIGICVNNRGVRFHRIRVVRYYFNSIPPTCQALRGNLQPRGPAPLEKRISTRLAGALLLSLLCLLCIIIDIDIYIYYIYYYFLLSLLLWWLLLLLPSSLRGHRAQAVRGAPPPPPPPPPRPSSRPTGRPAGPAVEINFINFSAT